MIKKNDVWLMVIVIIIAIVAIFVINITRSHGSKVVITVDGEIYQTMDLNKDATMIIEGDKESLNTVEIKDGTVRMSEANCPDKLCVKHRNIKYHHETIICLPNKVIIEIIGGEDNQVDSIAR